MGLIYILVQRKKDYPKSGSTPTPKRPPPTGGGSEERLTLFSPVVQTKCEGGQTGFIALSPDYS
jgi:hypothetical protein